MENKVIKCEGQNISDSLKCENAPQIKSTCAPKLAMESLDIPSMHNLPQHDMKSVMEEYEKSNPQSILASEMAKLETDKQCAADLMDNYELVTPIPENLTSFPNSFFKSMEDMNYEDAFQEVLKDLDIERIKDNKIKGYAILKEFINKIPSNYKNDIGLIDESLYFGIDRIGKISNIKDVSEGEPDGFNKTIYIDRIKGEVIRIIFTFGKNPETGDWEYVSCKYYIGF